ncbi:Transcriptional regulator, contains XRE-family HTH domain [Tistlia consotensis]|uniref:Transcriptional regulator, contains XRE-family HTH domain n=1 Tax=Tistlia consotensis USBA 355 TaxID=560819 RepID=A0A1Y6BQU6_9PROT|nr:helix-turn-helix transcriptional regulator [Tistlia consotensis]SMF16354.1 Transcriptional regulator, contains XRE-family HTH domain [Tistlia consotensis USBA 355]SNR41198.1 Transcriptional regulator, contains XRE-family HTH domain [Tistlia consotensis]
MHRRLWSARTRRGLSRAAASAALGVSSKHLQRVENAEREPTVAQVTAAATLYGVEARWLLLGERSPETPQPPVALAELLHRCVRAQARRDDPGGPQEPGSAAQGELARDVGILTLALLRRCAQPAEARPGWCGTASAGAAPGAPRLGSTAVSLSHRPAEALIERHAAFRAVLDWHARTGGAPQADEAAFQRQLPWLQILVPKPQGSPCLWCGQETPPAAIWGEAAAFELVGKCALPDAVFDRAISGEFLEVARTGRPIAQAARAPLSVEGRSYVVQWHRWIAPLRFLGHPAVASLAILDHDRRQEI